MNRALRRARTRFTHSGIFGLLVGLLFLLPSLAQAQSTITPDLYLHGSGGTANPPTLTADLLPPLSFTTKTKDSASLAFAGGNPWSSLGSWAPSFGSTGSYTLIGLNPLHLWTGLKGSGDVGAKIDLQAEVLVDGALLSSGLIRCVSTLTASAGSPADVSIAWSSIPATLIDPATHTVAVRLSARMGTNSDGTACGTKGSVSGVRAYFDSLIRPSRLGVTLRMPPPVPVLVFPNPLTLNAGATAKLYAIVFPFPFQAGTLTVSSSRPNVATVPATVPVGIGQLLIPMTVTGVSAGTTQITVTMNGRSSSSTARVTGGLATITSLIPQSTSITQGGSGSLTVSLNAVQSTSTTVTLTSSAGGVANVPAGVVVPAGQLSAPITVAANTVGQADVTASLNGSSATSHITVTAALPTVVALAPPVNQVSIGASGTLTVTLSAAQVSNTLVTLAANPPTIVTLPPNVTVPANQRTVTVQVTGAAFGTTMITAGLYSSSVQAAVDVVPPVVHLTEWQPPTQALAVGAIGTLTVSINAQQSGPTVVTLAVDQPTILQVPATVTVPPNQVQAGVTVTGLAVGAAQVTATLGTVTKEATVVVTLPPPHVVALIPAALDLVQGATGSLSLRIDAAQQTDTVVPLTTSNATVLAVPASATIPAGVTDAPVPVTGLALGTATVTAVLNGSVSSTNTVVPSPVTITSLDPLVPAVPPLTLAKGRSGLLRVMVNRVPTEPTVVSLSTAQTNLVTVPPTVTIPAGALSVDMPVTTQNEGTATIVATLNGTSASAQIVVTSPEVEQLTLSPVTPSLFAGETIAFTATGILSDGSTQALAGGMTWSSTSQAVASISSTGFASALSAGTTTIRATATNSLGSVGGETTLTVLPAPVLTLVPTAAALQVGQVASFIVSTSAPAPVNGLTVSLGLAGSPLATVTPATLFIPEGQTTASTPVLVTATGVGIATLTASAPLRTSASAILTIAPGVPTITGFSPASGLVGTVVTRPGAVSIPSPSIMW